MIAKKPVKAQPSTADSFAPEDPPSSDPLEPTQLPRIPITKIRSYDRNPRTEPNQKYEEIKQAILNKHSLDQQLTITRRPGEEHLPYLLYAGGNTRWRILKDLYEETQDEAFFYVDCLFRPFTSEFDLMVAHVGENENRGDLLWCDKARYVNQLRDQLEADAGKSLSQQELSNAITEHGWSISQETISRLEYTYDVLLPALPNALSAGLGEPRMRKIRQLENTIKKYLRYRDQPKEQLEAHKQWFVECLARHDSEDWDLAPVIRDIVDHLAQVCDESPSRVRIELEAFMRGSRPVSQSMH
jgi:ParB family protein of integrating conjugative element (PFGI_1 class)